MGILDGLKKIADTTQPIRQASRDVGKALNPASAASADPTGRKAAVAAGEAARKEAIDRGKGMPVTVIDSEIKPVE